MAKRAEAAASNALSVITEEPGSLLAAIVGLAKDPSVDVQKLQALLSMQERMETRQAETEFNQAFIRLQGKLPRVKKNGTLEYPVDKNHPEGRKRKISSFAKWEDIDAAIRPELDAEGFALSFNTVPRPDQGGGLLVTAILRHQSGHSTETTIPVPLDSSGGKNNLQGYGSTLSYGKRYAAIAALNIITEGEDDDGVRGGMKFVTDEQTAELDRLLKETNSDRLRFLQMFELADLGNMPADAYPGARNMLLLKVKK